ncbi:hypothetical protein CesoFtcFv8_022414 [Champsocephalus esox]|uniref:Uncharacterized protein n=1 Tax=Champsocephalus esox TaxID=159716 RepID=A0AAN8BBF2_9TELE|nr:hypothetical protein CesoFtcFv8_022414 [Champsocephalus esox]
MTSAGFNVTSSLTLVGFSSMSGNSSLLFFVFLLLYLFVLFSDSLVIYIICSQRALHRPMFAFVGIISAELSHSQHTDLSQTSV